MADVVAGLVIAILAAASLWHDNDRPCSNRPGLVPGHFFNPPSDVRRKGMMPIV
ncbi:hypothetical protein AB6806_20940 [Bosea sp. RCC_152_1]|uniref:hypothetical protein n=1 Tax=Bosea sp. RCC_152_1 TaxID=3239228 RepID=UPI003525547F